MFAQMLSESHFPSLCVSMIIFFFIVIFRSCAILGGNGNAARDSSKKMIWLVQTSIRNKWAQSGLQIQLSKNRVIIGGSWVPQSWWWHHQHWQEINKMHSRGNSPTVRCIGAAPMWCFLTDTHMQQHGPAPRSRRAMHCSTWQQQRQQTSTSLISQPSWHSDTKSCSCIDFWCARVCVSGDTRGLSSDNQSHNGHVTLPPDCTQHAWTYSSVINVHQYGLDLDLLPKNTLLRSPGDDLMQAAGCFSGRDVMDGLPRCKRGNTTQIWQQALPATFTLFLYKVKPTSECAEERVTHLVHHTLHPEFGSQLQPALWYWVATDKPARMFNMWFYWSDDVTPCEWTVPYFTDNHNHGTY